MFKMSKRVTEIYLKTLDPKAVSEFCYQRFAKAIIGECAGIYEAIDNGNEVEGTSDYLTAVKRRFDGRLSSL